MKEAQGSSHLSFLADLGRHIWSSSQEWSCLQRREGEREGILAFPLPAGGCGGANFHQSCEGLGCRVLALTI